MILGHLVTSEAAARLKTGMLKYSNIFVSQHQIRFFEGHYHILYGIGYTKVDDPKGVLKYTSTQKKTHTHYDK